MYIKSIANTGITLPENNRCLFVIDDYDNNFMTYLRGDKACKKEVPLFGYDIGLYNKLNFSEMERVNDILAEIYNVSYDFILREIYTTSTLGYKFPIIKHIVAGLVMLPETKAIAFLQHLDYNLPIHLQRRIVEKLCKAFPLVQFVFSINSPIPILGAPIETAFIKVISGVNEFNATLVDVPEWYNCTVDLLLSSPLFDFKNITPNACDKAKGLRTEFIYDDITLNEEVAKRVNDRANEYESVFDK